MHDLPLHLWFSITRLGGAGLTLPLAIAIALWLALGYSWRLAGGWLAVTLLITWAWPAFIAPLFVMLIAH